MILEKALLDPGRTQPSVGGTVGSLGAARMKLGCESKAPENKKHILEFEPFESCRAGFFWSKSPLKRSLAPHCPQ